MKTNPLPLQINQSSLQDYLECPRRFQLKHILKQPWPASAAEPLLALERAADLGSNFHLACHQFFSGVPSAVIEPLLADPDLSRLWANFLPLGSALADQTIFPEQILTLPLQGHRLLAKYDLLVLDEMGKMIIYDWKTSSRLPDRQIIEARAQTILYPVILAEAGSNLPGGSSLSPDKIEMRYIYPLTREFEIRLPYSQQQHHLNLRFLESTIAEIEKLLNHPEDFRLTEDTRTCLRCVYRSRCQRGTEPGDLKDLIDIEQEDLSLMKFDFENVIEIEF